MSSAASREGTIGAGPSTQPPRLTTSTNSQTAAPATPLSLGRGSSGGVKNGSVRQLTRAVAVPDAPPPPPSHARRPSGTQRESGGEPAIPTSSPTGKVTSDAKTSYAQTAQRHRHHRQQQQQQQQSSLSATAPPPPRPPSPASSQQPSTRNTSAPSPYTAPPPIVAAPIPLGTGSPRSSSPRLSPHRSPSPRPLQNNSSGKGGSGAASPAARKRTGGHPAAPPPSAVLDRSWPSGMITLTPRRDGTVPVSLTASSAVAPGVTMRQNSVTSRRSSLASAPVEDGTTAVLKPWLLPAPSKGILKVTTPPSPSTVAGAQPRRQARSTGPGNHTPMRQPESPGGKTSAETPKKGAGKGKKVQFDEENLRVSGCGSSQVYADAAIGFSLDSVQLDEVNRSPTKVPGVTGGGVGVTAIAVDVNPCNGWGEDSEWFNKQFGMDTAGTAMSEDNGSKGSVTPSRPSAGRSRAAASSGAAVAAATAAAIAASSPQPTPTAAANRESKMPNASPTVPSAATSPTLHYGSVPRTPPARNQRRPSTPRSPGAAAAHSRDGASSSSSPTLPAQESVGSSLLLSSIARPAPTAAAGRGVLPPPPLFVEDLCDSSADSKVPQQPLSATAPPALSATERRLLRALVRVNQRQGRATLPGGEDGSTPRMRDGDTSEPPLAEPGSPRTALAGHDDGGSAARHVAPPQRRAREEPYSTTRVRSTRSPRSGSTGRAHPGRLSTSSLESATERNSEGPGSRNSSVAREGPTCLHHEPPSSVRRGGSATGGHIARVDSRENSLSASPLSASVSSSLTTPPSHIRRHLAGTQPGSLTSHRPALAGTSQHADPRSSPLAATTRGRQQSSSVVASYAAAAAAQKSRRSQQQQPRTATLDGSLDEANPRQVVPVPTPPITPATTTSTHSRKR